jgi:arginine exporter protein ArgO
MNESQLKTRIFIFQLIDWVLILGILGYGIPATYYSSNPVMSGLLLLVGLAFINQYGNWSTTKIAVLKVKLEQLRKGAAE